MEPVEYAQCEQPAPVSDEQLVAMLVERALARTAPTAMGQAVGTSSPYEDTEACWCWAERRERSLHFRLPQR